MSKIVHKPKGVNIIFTPCSLRQPSRDDYYIVYIDSGYITVTNYNTRHKMWNVSNDDTSTDLTPRVVAWAPYRPVVRALKHFVDKEEA